jgi:hypothetical protein
MVVGAALVVACSDSGTLPSAIDVATPTGESAERDLLDDETGNGSSALCDLERNLLPLSLGNRWEYRSRHVLELVIHDSEPSLSVTRSRSEQEIIGIEKLFGRDYVVQEERTVRDSGGGPFVLWFRYRQDETGLYGADVAANIPPVLGRVDAGQASDASWLAMFGLLGQRSTLEEDFAAHPDRDALLRAWDAMAEKMEFVWRLRGRLVAAIGEDGPLDGEITSLAYPVHRGAHWTIRQDPRFEATVEGLQRVQTPAGTFWAWRIRIDLPMMGPNDEVLLWWGHVGMLGSWARLEGLATDSDGNVIGRFIGRTREVLTDFEDSELQLSDRASKPDGSSPPLAVAGS